MLKVKILAPLLSLILYCGHVVHADTREQFQVLIYSSPDKWHDATIPTALTELRKMSQRHTFGLTWTQQPDNFNDEYLAKFDVIVFLHSRGFDLNKENMDSFKKFIRGGKGFVGIHASSANKDRQELWFQQLVGRVFINHPEEQTAVLNVLDRHFPATIHLAEKWLWTDEWYSFGEALTDSQKILLTVDEKTYDPDRTWGDDRKTAMGEFHPVAWYQEFDGGRSFYTSLGHLPASYEDPWFLAHIYGGIYWAATGLGIFE